MWWKKNKWKVLLPVLILVVLVSSFWYGGNAPGARGWTVDEEGMSLAQETEELSPSATEEETEKTNNLGSEQESTSEETDETGVSEITETSRPQSGETAEIGEPSESNDSQETTSQQPETVEPISSEDSQKEPAQETTSSSHETQDPQTTPNPPATSEEVQNEERPISPFAGNNGGSNTEAGDAAYSEEQGMIINQETGKDQYMTAPVPEGRPVPVEPQDVTISDVAHTCTLTVRCDTVLDHLDWLDPEKVELIPEDGVVFATATVTFYEGESVFNVLQREMKKAKIHMEFENTPIYNSAYIEGINNLYEFDCGELSGWMYKVNDWFPNYGCSRYQLQEGDVIEWVYTCDLGVDVGGRIIQQ